MSVPPASATSKSPPVIRLASLDVYRGFIMVLMASAALGIPQVAKSLPGSGWNAIAPWLDHAPWSGGVLWDMIQPAFMFMVGVAAEFSVGNRLARGDSSGQILRHAAVRAVILVALGVLLASNWDKQTSWNFTNVLAQIGLGYFFLVLMVGLSFWGRVTAGVLVLAGYWLLFALWPLPPLPDASTMKWMPHESLLHGYYAQWNPHVNAAAAFDRWFLNLFPRTAPYEYGNGGYQTLNFVPSLVTMLMGLMCGERLRREGSSKKKLRDLVVVGVALTTAGMLLGLGACPIVKRIWTPSWTIWSGGIVILMLAGFYAIVDVAGWRKWGVPLTIVGMNSILVYLLFQLSSPWIRETLARHTNPEWFTGTYGPMVGRGGVLLVIWLLCWWLWRQKVFLRI